MSINIQVADGVRIPVGTKAVLIAALVVVSLVQAVFHFVGDMTDKFVSKDGAACIKAYRFSEKLPAPEPLDAEAEKIALGTDRELPSGITEHCEGLPHLRTEVRNMQRECRPGPCPDDKKDEYANLISNYIMLREQRAAWLERDYGAAGVKLAMDTYSTPEDLDIEKGLVARVKAGVYKPSNSDTKEFVAMLMNPGRGHNFLQPCPSARKTLR